MLKNGEDWGKLIAAKGFKKLPKVQNIVQSGHTVAIQLLGNLKSGRLYPREDSLKLCKILGDPEYKMSSGQSYKGSTIVNNDSRVENSAYYNSWLLNYECKLFIRLATDITKHLMLRFMANTNKQVWRLI